MSYDCDAIEKGRAADSFLLFNRFMSRYHVHLHVGIVTPPGGFSQTS